VLRRAGAPLAAFLETNAVTVTPIGSDVVLPGGSAQVRVQLRNSGGANATAVSATLSSPSPYVTITAATSTYPTVYVGATATNPTAYAFTVSNTAPCGIKLPFILTVNYTGNGPHPAVVPIGIQTGRPSPTSTTHSYTGPAVPIPDGDLDGVDIPFAISGAGALASVQFSIDGTVCNTVSGSTTVGLSHTWVGDVALKLTSPDGTKVTLLDTAGGPFNSANNFCQTVLDDTAATSIQAVTTAQAPFTGTFSPFAPLSTFVGQIGDGTWTLNASDNTFIDTGAVRAFSIKTRSFTCDATP
jgi:subtilisin-like proprotein convertase family protein